MKVKGIRVSFGAALVCGVMLMPWASVVWATAPMDYLQVPAETSPQSRWYHLSQIGVQSVSGALQLTQRERTHLRDNTGMLDLSDHACLPPLQLLWDREVLQNSEKWEQGIETGRAVVGYPSIVRNVHGTAPDGKYYLFYAIHDASSGIAVAISPAIDGKFRKLHELQPQRSDSRVLRAPERPRGQSHFSSPVVLWNPREQRWFLYFHYYANEWDRGMGHQRTALAVSADLSSHSWTPWTDRQSRLIAVLPTTRERWMNSQSTYHGIQRLPNSTWLAFLRGTGGQYGGAEWVQDPSKLGFAISRDGRHWAELPGNPLIHQGDGRNGRKGVYRPQFLARLADRFLLAWTESNYYDGDSRLVMAITRDFQSLEPVTVELPELHPADGAISPWREGNTLYFFHGSRQSAWRMLDGCAAQRK